MSIILSIDIGTTKICAAAYCTERKIMIGCESIHNTSINALPPGYHEQSPGIIMEACCFVVRRLLSNPAIDAGRVRAIAVTGQMHGVLLVDRKCTPVTNLMTWRDQRAVDLAVSMGDTYAHHNGCGLRAGYGGATLGFLAKHKVLEGAFTALSISDYVCSSFAGKIVSEPTHAASWGIYDIVQRQWNREMIRELCIPEDILPELMPSSKIIGPITPAMALQFGLKEGVMIFSSLGDNQATVIGARGQITDAAILNIGTGSQVSVPQKCRQYFNGSETRPMPDNSFILVWSSISGGWTYAYLKQFFQEVIRKIAGVDISDQDVYTKMNSFLEMDTRASDLYVDPRFSGTRSNPGIRGEIKSINAENFTPEKITRAFAQSMIQELYDMIPVSCMSEITSIIGCGNGIRKNPMVLKIAAECFGKPAAMAQTKEAAALGAALSAAIYY